MISRCPVCNSDGLAVNDIVVRNFIKEDIRKTLIEIEDSKYDCCSSENCHVGYYRKEEIFYLDQLKDKISFKDKSLDSLF